MKKPSEFIDKVDRALEMQVIDWLQWSEFPENIATRPDDSDMAQLALTLISKRKQAHTEQQEKLDKAVEALETIAKTEKTIYPHSMDSDKRFNMGIASAALREINEKSP